MRTSERTCCVCRSKADKRVLARLVLCGGALVWDVTQVAPGRGAYVHVEVACVSKVGNAATWERTFKLKKGTLQGGHVSEVAQSLMQEVHSKGI